MVAVGQTIIRFYIHRLVHTNYPTGVPIKLVVLEHYLLLVAGTKYYSINADAHTIKVATTYANAIANTPIDILTDAVAPVTVTGQIPDPFDAVTTYYVINISPTTIKLASTLANAQGPVLRFHLHRMVVLIIKY